MAFKDYFSTQANAYSQYRPTYPVELFEYLAQLTKQHDLAWDCACGNGQAAVMLADFYDRVIATDASAKQIENAVEHPKVIYKVAPAEKTNLKDQSIDLITVAQALHWFDLDKFYQEVKRILRINGIIAVWTYPFMTFDNTKLQDLFLHFANVVVGDYWPRERFHCDTRYENIPFPFKEIDSPNYFIVYNWSCDQFIGYLNTWSATNRYIKEQQQNPVATLLMQELQRIWPDASHKEKLNFEIVTKVGRV